MTSNAKRHQTIFFSSAFFKIHNLPHAERLELLANCAPPTRPARTGEAEAHAAILAREVGLDMTAHWQLTAASYFGRVSKERIVQAVRESAQAVQNIARMKKQAMAEASEVGLAGKGWLLALLGEGPDQIAA